VVSTAALQFIFRVRSAKELVDALLSNSGGMYGLVIPETEIEIVQSTITRSPPSAPRRVNSTAIPKASGTR
jgi:hypothetical protein